MTQSRDLKKKWIRGALLLTAIAGCQSGAPTGDIKDDVGSNPDIVEALADLPDAEVLQYSADGAVPQFVVGELGKIDPGQSAGLALDDHALRAALPPILKLFRLENKDLVLRKVTTDEVGGRHYRYTQKFNGQDVVASEIVVHVDFKGAITGANGTARGDIAPTLGAVAISDSAASIAIENDARWGSLAGRAVRQTRTVYVQAADGAIYKAHEQLVTGKRGDDPVEDRVFVDVETGNVVAVHPQIHHARNRSTYSANNGTSLPGTIKRTESQGPTADVDVNAAHDGAGHTYDMYNFFWNRDGIDNAGMLMISTVHYSSNYCNAFWNNVQMAYGDGNASQNCGPLARSIDVAAHEMTHGVTSRESNLTYSGESGGLNESLSDVWGGGTEAFVLGGKNGTLSLDPKVFLIGDEVLPPFLRSMCDPAADGVSKDIWTSGLGGVDVHYSSGPNNLVFCLLSKGGVHPRGKTTNMVPAIGMEKALRLMYKANVDLLVPSSNYAAMRNAMITGAQQLGYDTATQDAVACAYAAIAVGTAPASCGGTPPPPDGVLVNNVAQTISDSTVGSMKFWSLDVPSGQTSLTFTISGGTGDADMYVSFANKPSETVYQCRPYLNGNNETCTFTPPSAGKYWVGVRAYSAYSGVSLKGVYTSTNPGGCGVDPELTNGVGVTGIAGATGNVKYWCIKAPGNKTLTLKISGGTGDADLYTRLGSRPTTSTYACRPYLSGNNETCTHVNAAVGDWYVMLRGYTTYSGVTLIGSY
jgi:vibriolysin